MEFVAIDFETINQYCNSACSIGLAKMNEKGEVLDQYYTLIRPKILFFDPRCMAVHGLSENDIKCAESFDMLWPEIKEFIGLNPLVAHNAAFDINVLKGTLASYGITVPQYEYYCTLQMSRKLLPFHSSYSLTRIVPELLDISYNAHNAADDAYVCGLLFCYILKREAIKDKEDLDDYLQYKGSRYPKTISL